MSRWVVTEDSWVIQLEAQKHDCTSDAKEAGNAWFKKGEYRHALACYQRAIELSDADAPGMVYTTLLADPYSRHWLLTGVHVLQQLCGRATIYLVSDIWCYA